ncbi:MAG TPA: ABC transporter ATP-binding protein, partial [Acidimicrobiaceae bacterium]|nr:ABC transporter ATP-binding protein [Acidimicrobiaceae bacterium]
MIKIENLSKSFKVYPKRTDRLKEWLYLTKKQYHECFNALTNINLEIRPGEVFGLVGMNGAGKSTLLKILTGTMYPTSGSYQLKGRVAALLELGTGFHGELSGRENVRINGRLLGLSQDEVDERIESIKQFSELDGFFEKPVRTYSSGMYVRLAFALASAVDPDVLIIDEALSVGDAYFQQKCLSRIEYFKAKGVTILFVSHDPGAVKMLCDRVGLMDKGKVLEVGKPKNMLERYNAILAKLDGNGSQRTVAGGASQFGDHRAKVESVTLTDQKGSQVSAATVGERVKLIIDVHFNADIKSPTVGIMIRDRLGYDVFGTNTAEAQFPTGNYRKNDRVKFSFEFELNIGVGEYTITTALHSSRTHVEECYQWIDRVLSFKVLPRPDFRFL